MRGLTLSRSCGLLSTSGPCHCGVGHAPQPRYGVRSRECAPFFCSASANSESINSDKTDGSRNQSTASAKAAARQNNAAARAQTDKRASKSGTDRRDSGKREKPAADQKSGNTKAKPTGGKESKDSSKNGSGDEPKAVAAKRRRRKPKPKPTEAVAVRTVEPAKQVASSPPAPQVRTATVRLSTSSLLSSSLEPTTPNSSLTPSLRSKLQTHTTADDDSSDDDDEYFANEHTRLGLVPNGQLLGKSSMGGGTSSLDSGLVGDGSLPSSGLTRHGRVEGMDWSAMDVQVANLAPKRKSLHQRFSVKACGEDCHANHELKGWCQFEVKINFPNLIHMFEVLPDLLTFKPLGDGVFSLTLPGDYLVHVVEREDAVEAALQQLQALMMDPMVALDLRWCRNDQADPQRHQPLALVTVATPRRCVMIRMSAFKSRHQLPDSLHRLLTSTDMRLLVLDWTHQYELRMQAQFGIGRANLPGLMQLREITTWFGYTADASLRDLLSMVLGVEVSKKIAKRMAAANWESPRLSTSQVKNAALDSLGVGAIFRQLRFTHSMRFRCPWCAQRSDGPIEVKQQYRCAHPGCMCSFTSFDEYDSHCTSTSHACTHVRTTCYWCGRSVVLLRDNVWQVVPMQSLTETEVSNTADSMQGNVSGTEQQTEAFGMTPLREQQQKRSVLFSSSLVPNVSDVSVVGDVDVSAGKTVDVASTSEAGSRSGRVQVRLTSLVGVASNALHRTQGKDVGSKQGGKKVVIGRSSLISGNEQGDETLSDNRVLEKEAKKGEKAQPVKARVSLLASD